MGNLFFRLPARRTLMATPTNVYPSSIWSRDVLLKREAEKSNGSNGSKGFFDTQDEVYKSHTISSLERRLKTQK